MRRHKIVVGDLAVVNARGRRELRGRKGIVTQVGPTKGEYGIEFVDGRVPSLVYLEAVRLDRGAIEDLSAHNAMNDDAA